jgi:hypothetical protein
MNSSYAGYDIRMTRIHDKFEIKHEIEDGMSCIMIKALDSLEIESINDFLELFSKLKPVKISDEFSQKMFKFETIDGLNDFINLIYLFQEVVVAYYQ